MSISAIFLLLLEPSHPFGQLGEVAHLRRVLRPGGVIVEWKHAGVLACPMDRARNHRACRDLHVVYELQVPEDYRGGPDGAVPPDVRAAGHGDAACHGGMRADAAVVADLDLVVELHAVFD